MLQVKATVSPTILIEAFSLFLSRLRKAVRK